MLRNSRRGTATGTVDSANAQRVIATLQIITLRHPLSLRGKRAVPLFGERTQLADPFASLYSRLRPASKNRAVQFREIQK